LTRIIKIPKEHHRFILGSKGKRLSDLELLTATKISVPRQDDPSDEIKVTGTRDGIDKVVDEIQLISDEQVGQCSCRVHSAQCVCCLPVLDNMSDLSFNSVESTEDIQQQ